MSESAEASVWRRLFADHPAALHESYSRHFLEACRLGVRLLEMGITCFLHAVIPGVFEDTASRGISKLAGEMSKRRGRRSDGDESMSAASIRFQDDAAVRSRNTR